MSKKKGAETNNSEERNGNEVVTLPKGTLFAILHTGEKNYQIIFDTEMDGYEYAQLISILSTFVEENTMKPAKFPGLPC